MHRLQGTIKGGSIMKQVLIAALAVAIPFLINGIASGETAQTAPTLGEMKSGVQQQATEEHKAMTEAVQKENAKTKQAIDAETQRAKDLAESKKAQTKAKAAEQKQKATDAAASQKTQAERTATAQKQKAQSTAQGQADKATQQASDKTAEGIGKVDKSLDSLMTK